MIFFAESSDMKIYCLSVYERKSGTVHLTSSEKSLGHISFFGRKFASDFIDEISVEIINKIITADTVNEQADSVINNDYKIYLQINYDRIATVITDHEYPVRAAARVAARMLKGDDLKVLMDEPIDPILLLQKDVESTVGIVHNNLEKIMARGDRLDNLVEKSEQLSAASKKFYRTSKKMNSCCVVA
jgi:synaptobrevin family protein YKT6